jgi:F0F1-type ATP synthase assembly protein I
MTDRGNKQYWREGLMAFARMSGWVVGPVLAGIFLGKWIDARFHSAPYALFSSIALAFLASCLGIMKEAFRYLKTIDTTHTTNGTDDDHHAD